MTAASTTASTQKGSEEISGTARGAASEAGRIRFRLRSRRLAGAVSACIGAAVSLGLGGCQAPHGTTPFAYGSAPACSSLAPGPVEPESLRTSLAPLRAAFDDHAEVPRLVAL
ncbi:MAG: hypothetical protein AAGG01_05195, partial [Planctomycetota bacterium]